jgi:hypothetical protein
LNTKTVQTVTGKASAFGGLKNKTCEESHKIMSLICDKSVTKICDFSAETFKGFEVL